MEFMQMERNGVIPSSSLWSKARFGEDTIIGNLDTGVWSESQSFREDGLGPVPSRWKGICETAENVRCNRKLIGARSFNEGYKASTGIKVNDSACDHDGHGTHTLWTAGGRFVANASVFGVGNGTAKGGSPLSRVASYKVCWPPAPDGNECFDADVLAAFDMAIQDGVDILSLSIGSAEPHDYFEDGIAIGSLHAVRHGITVVSSAGNSGPDPASLSNVAPWILTVAASTLDREFQSFVQLANGERFKGLSMSKPLLPVGKLYSLITGAQAKLPNASAADAMLCKEGKLDPEKANSKMMVCLNDYNTETVEKGRQASLAGAVAMILCNDEASGNDISADLHILPATHINFNEGQAVFSYANSTYLEPMATLTTPEAALGIKPAPYMTNYSSQGPNTVTPGILKPDVTAPGDYIIAAYIREESPSGLQSDPRMTFHIESGTSMSCPHVAGLAGLLKTMYPSWSPAAIKSAIMTTASTLDNRGSPILNGSYVEANSFNYGSGHIRPNSAGEPGLVYDLTFEDYLDFLCATGYNETKIKLFSEAHNSYKCPKEASVMDLNYPSITVPAGSVTVIRKLTNVGSAGTYRASVREPYGVTVSVEPSELVFESVGQVKSFNITLKPKWTAKGYIFGGLTWSDGIHFVTSPIVVIAVN